MPEISVLVDAGKATASAPLGPALGPLGVNIGKVVAEINEKTRQFAGVKIPVKISVDVATKSFEIKVGSPPTSALVRKEIKIPKGSPNPKMQPVGNITMQQVKNVAEMKLGSSMATSLRSVAREVIGVCNSMGVTVEGMNAKEAQKEFAKGRYDKMFSG